MKLHLQYFNATLLKDKLDTMQIVVDFTSKSFRSDCDAITIDFGSDKVSLACLFNTMIFGSKFDDAMLLHS